ncbi:kinesin-like protein KIFC1 isoform X2 [Narcine bancroftii]|uniref:kinesin-like protein KIFC1 isoform X2 n=1 Tax=Narcine bancroftii TaxID=1343680 RepID=UPI0038319D4F
MDGNKAVSVVRPADFQSVTKKRKLQDESSKNIGENIVNRNPSRLPQLSLKRAALSTSVNINQTETMKKVHSQSASLSTTRSKVALSQNGVRMAVAVKRTRTGVPGVSAASTSTIAVPKRRPAWDLKGQLEDMKKRMSEYSIKLNASEYQRKRLQESDDLHTEHLSDANSQIRDLEVKLQTLESLLQSRESELVKYRSENAALLETVKSYEAQVDSLNAKVGSLAAQVEELSTLAEKTKSMLLCKEQELVQKTLLVEEQQKIIVDQEHKLQNLEQTVTNLELERRTLHNTVQELKGNIRVICRVRPLLASEKGRDVVHFQFLPHDKKAISLIKQQESRIGHSQKEEVIYNFSFDRVFQPMAKQEEVFEDISQLVQSALDGYNVCIFAYGQTGSGKTYTMEGPDTLTSETKGMIPRAVDQLFCSGRKLETMGWEYKFTASFLEIYNETIRDLLVIKPEKNVQYEIKQLNGTSDQLRVTNLKYVGVSREEEVHKLISLAKANRSVAKTAMNDCSSRSHSVFQLHIEGIDSTHGIQCTSILSLVDLAGSERLDKSHSKGDRLRETQAINTSLSCLGHVIMSLTNKESHIPFRNSKLTYLLQNGLGGNSKTLMFVNLSPLEENCNESVNTLRFARQVNECMIGTAQRNRNLAL